MHIAVQTWYNLQYLTMILIAYINAPKEPEFLALLHGMEYLTQHPHEPIICSRDNIFKANVIPLKFFFKSGKDYNNQTKQYSNFLHTY